MKQQINTLNAIIKRKELTLTELADDTGVILDMQGSQVLSLNASALVIYRDILSGNDDINSLANHLTQHFTIDKNKAKEDATSLINKLSEILS